MRRYLKLFYISFILNIKELKSYHIDFVLGSIAMFFKNLSNLFIIYTIYNLVNEINGWSIKEMIYLYSVITISFSVWRCFFINTLNISYYVTSGGLDLLLTKPINSLFLIFMENFDEDAWGDLAVGILLYFYISYMLKIKLIIVFLIFLLSILGGLVFSGLSTISSIFSVIYNGPYDFTELPYIIYEFAKYPLSIFNPIISFILKTIIPIGWIAYIPSSLIFSKVNGNLLLIILFSFIISIIYFYIIYKIWNYAILKYSSSGT